MAAIDDLNALVTNLPGSSLLTVLMKTDALASALIPDAAGVWPAQVGYVSTYDLYFAAGGLIAFLQAQPVVRQSSSEGTSVAVDAPNWSGLATWYRSMSVISQNSNHGVLHRVAIPEGPHVFAVPMSYGGAASDNIDTDVG